MLEQEQSQRWQCPHEDEWENAWQTPVISEKTVMVMAKIFIYYEVGMVSLAQSMKDKKRCKVDAFGKRIWRFSHIRLKELKRLNILIVEQFHSWTGSLMFEGGEKVERWTFKKMNRQKSWRGLKEFEKMNIFIAEHEAECLKELKRQKDEYLRRLKAVE